MKQMGNEKDIEIECKFDPPPLIPEQKYEVGFVRAEIVKNLWGRKKIFLYFQVLQSGEYFGVILFLAMNLPSDGRFSESSKFLQQWTLASGALPKRRDRLSTKVFRGKVFVGEVRTVKKIAHSSGRLKERESSSFYSVIDQLVEVRAGR